MKFLIWCFIFCILFNIHTKGQDKDYSEYKRKYSEGYIFITGTTNINGFRLKCPLEAIDSKVLDSLYLQKQDTSLVEIDVPLKNFKADNPIMFRDFLKLVNANVYPNISIGIEYPYVKIFINSKRDIVARFYITMAGVSNSYDILCKVEEGSNNKLYVQGREMVELSDFNLEPPVKFQGLVRVKDDVMITFGLVFKTDNNFKLTQF